MANKRDPAGQFNTNIIEEVIKAFGDVPATFTTLIDLGTIYTYQHLLIINSLDEDITIKFGTKNITFQAGKDLWMDNFKFDGILQYKYNTVPTSGSIQIVCY